MHPDSSKQLGDKYVLLDLLGIGGMAEVYRAKLLGDEGFEKQIVIKKLLPQVARDQEMVHHFIGEAKLAALLQHENIAATYDFGEIDGEFFLAMEYLFGTDLHALLQRTRELGITLEPKYCLMIGSQICEGMEYAHSLKDLQGQKQNVIHRDLTPHNIFITYDGKIKIFDFGVAKAEILDNKTQAGIVKGKVSYMSPEQMSGGDIDSRSDIFSIGILLYEMLSGRRMYSGDTATLIRKCLTAEYDRLEDVAPGLHPEIYRILDKALAAEPVARYQSCADMLADIDEVLFSMKQRSTTQPLKILVRELFSGEYEKDQEKALAVETRSRTGSQRKDDTGDEATVILTRDSGAAQTWWSRKKLLFGGVAAITLILIAIGIQQFWYTPEPIATAPSGQREGSTPSGPAVQTAPSPPVVSLAQSPGGTESAAAPVASSDLESAKNRVEQHLKEQEARKTAEKSGLAQILAQKKQLREGNRLVAEAERSLAAGNLSEAQKIVAEGLALYPDHAKLQRLQARTAELVMTRESSVQELARKARQRLEEDELTTPVGDSAYDYYREIEKIDPGNSLAQDGFRDIVNRYAVLAEKAYRKLDYQRAEHYVNKGLEIEPDHFRLQALKADLSRSEPEKYLRSFKKNINSWLTN